MAETANLTLPLLAAGQAQKHVTVNEALTRLDMLVMLSVLSRDLSAPPGGVPEGARYIVASGASGAWAGQAGSVAVKVNGGWDFAQPAQGWRAYVAAEGLDVVFASGVWTSLAPPPVGQGALSIQTFDHILSPGGGQATDGQIPAGALVFGVTARVIEAIGGAPTWSLGVAAAPTRYGAGIGAGQGAVLAGARGAPLAHAAATPLWITPEAGAFTTGRVRLAIHFLTLSPPPA